MYSLEITAHCDVRFFVPYKYSYLRTYLLEPIPASRQWGITALKPVPTYIVYCDRI